MSNYFDNVYVKRLNRYGIDYATRVQAQREKEFENLLYKSVYRVDFDYNNELQPGVKTKYKQDDTKAMQYLLTRVNLNIPNGTILMIKNKDGEEKPWMIYYLEEMVASGYNRYILLRMTHYIKWKNRAGVECASWVYMYGQEDNMLKDELKSRSRMDALYTENLKSSFFVMPFNINMRKDDYFEVGEGEATEAYRVTGYDTQSTPGVQYVTVDPIYIYDKSDAPTKPEGDTSNDYFWLSGGAE